MKLVIGGAYQGKGEYVKREYGDLVHVIDSYHKRVKMQVDNGQSPILEARSLLERYAYDDLVIICDEVGSGVIPMDAKERNYRESVGRVCCFFAEHADEVVRVVCGIGTRIK